VPETAGYERGAGIVAGEGRDRHRRQASSQRRRQRHPPARKATVRRVIFSCRIRAAWIDLAIGGSIHPARSEARIPARYRAGTVTFPASPSRLRRRPVTDPVSRPLSRAGRSRRRNPCRTSVAPPDPLRPGRLVTATPSRGRHETPGTFLGRPRWPEARRISDDRPAPKHAAAQRLEPGMPAEATWPAIAQ
jgi:hypothetical protein